MKPDTAPTVDQVYALCGLLVFAACVAAWGVVKIVQGVQVYRWNQTAIQAGEAFQQIADTALAVRVAMSPHFMATGEVIEVEDDDDEQSD